VVEPSARFEDIKIPLSDPVHGVEEVSAVLGVPRWWPTGARVSVVLAHGAGSNYEEPAIVALHRELTEQRYLCLRLNFPFAEAGKRKIDDPQILQRTLRAAIAMLARDPTAAPAHLFLIGRGLGAEVVAGLSLSRLRADGLVLLGYPLHPAGKTDEAEADQLYRVVAPMLFMSGTRDRNCDLDTLRRMLARVGAPTQLHAVEGADQNFKVLKKSSRSQEETDAEMLTVVDSWIAKILGD
jgi:predicted alpha/beta-hydrolase family hydrolase